MSADLRIETFQNLQGDLFRLCAPGDGELELCLTEVTPLSTASAAPGTPRTPFALYFHGPSSPWARQATYRLENGSLGAVEIFLVPLGPDERGMRYEAVFT